jgi:hypothetical protein
VSEKLAMRVWVTYVIALFSLVELYEWIQAVKLPLPIYGLAGLALALISNAKGWLKAEQLSSTPLQPGSEAFPEPMPNFKIDAGADFDVDKSNPSARLQVELPSLSSELPPQPSISFTIHKGL